MSPPGKIIQDAHVKYIITTPLKENCDNNDAFTLSEINFTKFSSEGRIPKDILLLLRSQGFYGFRSTVEDGGEGLTVTEATRLFEELASIDLSLSETVAVPATFGYRAIELFGSDEQV